MAKKTELTLEKVFDVLRMFGQFSETATFEKVAKELKCTRYELWTFVNENKWHFRVINTVTRSSKPLNYISGFWNNELANPHNPACIELLRKLYSDVIIVEGVFSYGPPEVGWHIVEEDEYGINSPEKLKAVADTGIVHSQRFCLGGFNDGWEEDYEYGWWSEQHKEISAKLKEAGWTLMTIKDVRDLWIRRKKDEEATETAPQ